MCEIIDIDKIKHFRELTGLTLMTVRKGLRDFNGNTDVFMIALHAGWYEPPHCRLVRDVELDILKIMDAAWVDKEVASFVYCIFKNRLEESVYFISKLRENRYSIEKKDNSFIFKKGNKNG